MSIDRPIFVVAPPRCGTSLLYRCVASHPDVGYFNPANKKLPHFPWLAHLVTRLGWIPDTPRESRRLWYRFFPHRNGRVADAHDVKTAADVTDAMRRFYGRLVGRVLELRGARRFASKLPAQAVQVEYLEELFPGAMFLHPVRDWRAVVSSTVLKRARDFGGRWFGVRPPGWEEAERWPPEDGAAWQFAWVHRYLEERAAQRPATFLRVPYERLCREPGLVLDEVFAFLGLRRDAEVEARLPRDVAPRPEKWRDRLPPETLARLMERYGEVLSRYQSDP